MWIAFNFGLVSLVYGVTNYIYPISGSTYFQTLLEVPTISENSQFSIQPILTIQQESSFLRKYKYILVANQIIDMSEGTIAGTNFQNNYIGILYFGNSSYKVQIWQVNQNGVPIIISNNTEENISDETNNCLDILLVSSFAYIQCVQMQTGQLTIYQQSMEMQLFNTLQTNIINSSQITFSDLDYYENSTGQYLISTIIANETNIYYIPISNSISSQVFYNSLNAYTQLEYLPNQSILMLLSNNSFQLLLNNINVFSTDYNISQFSYYLYAYEQTLIISFLTQNTIEVYKFNVETQNVKQLETQNRNNTSQTIRQMFINTKYIILLGATQLEVYEYLLFKQSISEVQIDRFYQGYVLSQSNYIGVYLENNTLLQIQINLPALVCVSCSGNGTFTLTYPDNKIVQYQYFTLQNIDTMIYPISSVQRQNYTIEYPAQRYYQLNQYIGQNISISIQYQPNPYLNFTVYCIALHKTTEDSQYVFIQFIPNIVLFLEMVKGEKFVCSQHVTGAGCTNAETYFIQAVNYQQSDYTSFLFVNTGTSIWKNLIYLNAAYFSVGGPGLYIEVSSNLNTTSNITSIALINTQLYVLILNFLQIYDINGPTLEQTFIVNYRNIWASNDYPGFTFCDNFTGLGVYQYFQSTQVLIVYISYQILNSTSASIGLLYGGVYISLINTTTQGLYFYNRQNTQSVQLNQIPYQQINVQTTMTTLTTYTSHFFYIYVINNGNYELSIYQAFNTSFNSLYQSIYVPSATLTQISCSSNDLQLFDLCLSIWSGIFYKITVPHIIVLDIESNFDYVNYTLSAEIMVFNGYNNITTNVNITYGNPAITLQNNEVIQALTVNSTQESISINPQLYFTGNIQNYSIQSPNSNVSLTPMINLLYNYSQVTTFAVETLGYVFLGNDMNISIINESNIQIYQVQSNSTIITLFTDINTGYPVWIISNKTGIYYSYYNISSLSVYSVTGILYGNMLIDNVFYYNGPLLLIIDTWFLYYLSVTLVQDSISIQTSTNLDLNQAVNKTTNAVQFLLSTNVFGFLYQTEYGTNAIITVNNLNGVISVYQDVIKHKFEYFFYDGQQFGQGIQNDTLYISLLIAGEQSLYQMNLYFKENRFLYQNVSNQYYYIQFGSSIMLAVSEQLTLCALDSGNSSILQLSLNPNATVNQTITIASYLNESNVVLNSLILLSNNILVYSTGSITQILKVSDQLSINYSSINNSSNISISAYNQYSQSTQSFIINPYTPPIPIPAIPTKSDNGFNYWLTLWISLGLIVIIIIITVVCYFKSKIDKKKDDQEIQLQGGGYYDKL